MRHEKFCFMFEKSDILCNNNNLLLHSKFFSSKIRVLLLHSQTALFSVGSKIHIASESVSSPQKVELLSQSSTISHKEPLVPGLQMQDFLSSSHVPPFVQGLLISSHVTKI